VTSRLLSTSSGSGAEEPRPALPALPKAPTGIRGLDEVTGGGLPLGRPTIVCGPAGCGKTLLAMEFLIRGIMEYGEPGVFVAFEETAAELTANVASLGFDLKRLEAEGLLVVDYIDVVTDDIQEAGDWDLEGLFIRLGFAIDSVGAKRIAIDTLEAIFQALPNNSRLRSELRRLFVWLKARGLTALVTAERGDGLLTRNGIEEYVSDCVIVLDHRVSEQTSTRRMRILKYRGSLHGTNEYPFLIGDGGIEMLPITSLGLQHAAPTERMSTGTVELDEMLGGPGVFRGSSVLVSGMAGTGKSSIVAQACDAACRRGERALYLGFEESADQIMRNMGSIGIDLRKWVDAGLLRFHCVRPTLFGLEAHLSAMKEMADAFRPTVVVTDPISNLAGIGNGADVSAMLARQVEFLKGRGVTAMFTSLTANSGSEQAHQLASLMDVWILVDIVEGNGERNRTLAVLKARGIANSKQVREFLITDDGVALADVYVGPHGELIGTARTAQEELVRADVANRLQELEQRRLTLEQEHESIQAEQANLMGEIETDTPGAGTRDETASTTVRPLP
jgi:circadian clock protein KaiC